MEKKVDIIVLLDRSGSMESVKNETIAGYNNFLKEQRKLAGKVSISLYQFDDRFQKDYEMVDIEHVESLTKETFVPRGLTALLDAMGKAIKMTNKRHKLLAPESRPNKTIFVIITDGEENHSKKYNRAKIFKKISKMEKENRWEFVFLGANQDAIGEASKYGIHAKRAMSFAADAAGTHDMFYSLAKNIHSSIAENGDFEFTHEQREKQKRN